MIVRQSARNAKPWWLGWAILLVLVSVAQLSLAQNGISQAQLETFRNLPPDQQQAVLNALSGSSATGDTNNQAPLSNPPTTRPRTDAMATAEPMLEPAPPRAEASSTLILQVELTELARGNPLFQQAFQNSQVQTQAQAQQNRSEEQTIAEQIAARQTPVDEARRAVLTDRRDRILSANPYRLDPLARLSLPFLPPIELKGLQATEIAQRLNADPRLSGLVFNVSLLPLEPVGTEALKPFGYDLFSEVPTTFAPATDVPVPANYVIGPGDTFIIDLFGKTTGRYTLVVSREGRLQLPDIGPLQVSGLTFTDASAQIQQRIAEQMIGVQASITMGELRSIRIFLVGSVTRPGSYTVSGLSTMMNALFAGGGVSQAGSLRNVELKRNGATIGRLDLYDLLLNGDTSDDQRLLPGDAILVQPLGVTAGIGGYVLRPAIYELRDGQTVADLLAFSGGLTPDADPTAARLERIDGQRRTVINLDLTVPTARLLALRAGDVLTVPRVLEERTQVVTLEGYVQRPGQSAWRQGMRLSDLIGSLEALKVNADQRYVLIRREHLPSRQIEVLSADLTSALAVRGGDADPLLQSGDRVMVFSLQRDRGTELARLLDEVKMQARDNRATPTVFVNGRVRSPGEYPLEVGMKVSDLLSAGGGLDDTAFAGSAELTRFEVVNGEKRQTEVIKLTLASVLESDAGADRELKPYDVLTVQRTPEWYEQGSVTLRGEVKFPGVYPLRKGETLGSVIERAGGLTDEAYPEGTVFTRIEIREQQQQQIETLTARMQSDLSVLALQTAQTASAAQSGTTTVALGQSLLTQLRSAKASGRLVINVPAALAGKPGGEDDLSLEDGDVIAIPKLKQYVAVIGEVQNPTAHIWRKDLERNDYIDLSGGTGRNADKKHIYVVRADGSVMPDGDRWFSRNPQLNPGDTVVVPLDAGRMRPLPLWTSVTQIIYQMAIAAAAVNSF